MSVMLHCQPEDDAGPFIPEAFMNHTFNMAPAPTAKPQDMTFSDIPPMPNSSIPSGLAEPSLTASAARMSSVVGLCANNSSSCNNLDIVSGGGVAAAAAATASSCGRSSPGLSEMAPLAYRSESTPELTELSRPSTIADLLGLDQAVNAPDGGKGAEDAAESVKAKLQAAQEYNMERNNLTLPMQSGIKRSNLKKRMYAPSVPSSFTTTFDHRPAPGSVEGSKKSISFSSIVHFQVNPDAERENLLEDSNSFDVVRSNSETGPRPSLRDLFKRVPPAQEISGKREAGSGLKAPPGQSSARWEQTRPPDQLDPESDLQFKPWAPAAVTEGSIFSRALKNLRGKQMKGGEERKHRFIVVKTEQQQVAPQAADAAANMVDAAQPIQNELPGFSSADNNEDTMTSLCGSEWAVQLRAKRNGVPPSAGSVSMASDDVFGSQKSRHGSGEPQNCLPEILKNSLVIILSGIYGIILIVLGLVLPISETYADPKKTHFFEIFYLYLYAVSLIFLIYVYTYLLRREELSLLTWSKRFSSRLSLRFSRNSSQRSSLEKESDAATKVTSPGGLLSSRNSFTSSSTYSVRSRRRKIGFNPETSHHTGSFYLRVGVIAFGIGSMLHSGLVFGHYFEINHLGHPCSDIIEAIKPVAHLCFTFVQMYFVFMNSKMCVHKYKTLARFGLIHMSATNICVWLRSIVVETLHVIMSDRRGQHEAMERYGGSLVTSPGNTSSAEVNDTEATGLGTLPEIDCHWDAMMGRIVEKSSLYLYPCTIEYSLVCACVLYVMWSNVGEGSSARRLQSLESASDDGVSRESTEEEEEQNHRMSVDCAGSSRGLFLGILLFVFCVVCLICFYVLSSSEEHTMAATVLGHLAEEVVYVLALVATVVAAHHMRGLHYTNTKEVGLEEILMLISLSGLGLFGVFSIVSGSFYIDTLHGGMTVMTNVLMLLQAGSQATFILAALRASAKHRSQIRNKPGRQYVVFLLISNFALWALNTFETQRIEHNVIQVQFYGPTAWAIFSHISVPLGIYFRFHATVSLSTIWKKAWKLKNAHHLDLNVHQRH